MRVPSRIISGFITSTFLFLGCAAPELPEDAGTGTSALSKQTIALSTGISMAYVERGDPAGAPVVFLHGYTDTARSFHPTVSALLARSPHLHVFVLDQRGHGASSMPPAAACAAAPEQCFRPIDMASDVIAFMDQKGIPSATIVGHSMGSFVGQELGLTYPARVDSLVLIGSAAKIAGNVVLQDYILADPVEGSWKVGFEAQGYTFPDDVYDLTPLDANAGAMDWIEGGWVVDPTADPSFLAAIVPETAATKMGAWIGAARALAAVDNTTRLHDLTVPTLVLWATQDAFFPDADQADLRDSLDVAAAACEGATYHFKQYGKRPLSELGYQTDDLGHNTQWGAPAEVAADIARHMQTGAPTKDWYYASLANPQITITKKGQAPILRNLAEDCD